MKASLKSINITPPVGMQMAGYSERTHGADGIHDEIYAKILVMDDGSKKVALAICDLIGIDLYAANKVKEIVAANSDIESEYIMISAIHTHSSVNASRMHSINITTKESSDPESDQAYYQQLIQKLANGILWANRDLKDARIGFGKGELHGLGTNRNNPSAYYDTSVNVIKIEDMNSNVIGIISNHACHPTVIGHENYFYTADYPAFFRKHMEDLFPHAIVAFSQGAAGSASTRYTKKNSSFEEADRLSMMLAGETLKVLASIETTDTVRFSGKCSELVLNVKEYPSEEECLANIKLYEEKLEKLKNENADKSNIRKAYVTLQGVQRNYRASKIVNMKSVKTIMQYLDLGVCKIVTLPGDVFGEIARDIKDISKDQSLFVVGYTNDSVGYIVSNEGYAMDCYEKNMTFYDNTSHSRILQVAETLLK